MGKSFAMNYLFLPFFCHFLLALGLFLGSFILSGRDELLGSQVFSQGVGTVGQLGQLKISIIQNARIAIYPYN